MIGPLFGRNAIAAKFYDGPGWMKFRPWERQFLRMVGGEKRAHGDFETSAANRPRVGA